MVIQSLNGTWNLEAESVYLNKVVNNGDSISMNIPGDIYGALEKKGLIENPIINKNAENLKWISKSNWLLEKEFKLEKEDDEKVFISVRRISSPLKLSVNNATVKSLDNPAIPYLVDITDYVKDGINSVSFSFVFSRSEEDIVSDKENQDTTPHGYLLKNRIGIYESVELIKVKDFIITESSVYTVFDKASSSFLINYDFTAEAFINITIMCSLGFSKGQIQKECNLNKGKNNVSLTLKVRDDQIEKWDPNGYGIQHQYPATIQIGDIKIEKMISFRKVRFSLKPFELDINGKKLTLKEAEYKGLDSVPIKCTPDLYKKVVETAKEMNLNALLVKLESYESPVFYSECARQGLLISQEIRVNQDIRRMEESISYMVKRLKGEPSLIAWSLTGADDNSPLVKEAEKIIFTYDKEHTIIPPSYNPSEISSPSFPSLSEIRQFMNQGFLNITSPVMEYHQEKQGLSEEIISEIARNYLMPSSFENFLYLSQVAQALSLEEKILKSRMDRNVNGYTLSYLKSIWPATSASVLNYDGEKKLAYYAIKRLNYSLLPALIKEDNRLLVYVLNGKEDDEEVDLKVKFMHFNGQKKETKYFSGCAKAGEATKIGELPLFAIDGKETFSYVKLTAKNTIKEKTILLEKTKTLALENPKISMRIEEIDDTKYNICLKCEKPAFFVALDQGGLRGEFSDNLLSLRPTSEKNIIFRSEENVSIERLMNTIKIYSLYSSVH